jgi:hypothetical protein
MPDNYRTKQRVVLAAAIVLWSAGMGFHTALAPQTRESDAFLWLLLGILVTSFCSVDSKLQKRPIPTLALWLLFETWPVSGPAYIVLTRSGMARLRAVLWIMLPVMLFATAWMSGALLAGIQLAARN